MLWDHVILWNSIGSCDHMINIRAETNIFKYTLDDIKNFQFKKGQ